MRTRHEIVRESNEGKSTLIDRVLILETLLDVREILGEIKNKLP